MLRKIVRFLLPPLVLLVGLAGFIALVKMRPVARKVTRPTAGMLVQAIDVERAARAVEVRGYGAVMAAQAIDVQPQVGGQVVELNPKLVAGGRLKAGEKLFRIEAADYEAVAAERRAQVERAEQDMEIERGRQKVAAKEWKLLGKEADDDAARGRALRQPQLRSAEAALTSAKSALRKARLDVARTQIDVPFNALVINEDVDLGQVVRVGANVAKLVGTDEFWVQVAVPVGDLDWFEVPGARARVIHDVGGRRVERDGRVVRLLGDLDPVGRMARVIVAIEDPLSLDSDAPPLLLGAYVEVIIQGRELQNVVEIPRLALRPGDKVWTVADRDFSGFDLATVDQVLAPLGKLPGTPPSALTSWRQAQVLAIHPVRVARRMRDVVLVSEGLNPGDQLITSRIGAPIAGAPIRVERPDPGAGARAELKP